MGACGKQRSEQSSAGSSETACRFYFLPTAHPICLPPWPPGRALLAARGLAGISVGRTLRGSRRDPIDSLAMQTTISTRHRWFRYSLRTMFVVMTAFAVWLGWQSFTVRARRLSIETIEAGGGLVYVYDPDYPLQPTRPRIPFWRPWFGDQVIDEITLAEGSDARQLEWSQAQFPEASVRILGSSGFDVSRFGGLGRGGPSKLPETD
jgi:hypothetical protein